MTTICSVVIALNAKGRSIEHYFTDYVVSVYRADRLAEERAT